MTESAAPSSNTPVRGATVFALHVGYSSGRSQHNARKTPSYGPHHFGMLAWAAVRRCDYSAQLTRQYSQCGLLTACHCLKIRLLHGQGGVRAWKAVKDGEALEEQGGVEGGRPIWREWRLGRWQALNLHPRQQGNQRCQAGGL